MISASHFQDPHSSIQVTLFIEIGRHEDYTIRDELLNARPNFQRAIRSIRDYYRGAPDPLQEFIEQVDEVTHVYQVVQSARARLRG